MTSVRADDFHFKPLSISTPLISRDGHVIVYQTGNTAARIVDFGAPVTMAPPANAQSFYPTALSADGSTVVGYGLYLGTNRPMRWQALGGTRLLIPLGNFDTGYATAVSGDGLVIAGTEAATHRAFRWTKTTGALEIPAPIGPPTFYMWIVAASSFGNVIGGFTYEYVPFLWNNGTTTALDVPIGQLASINAMNEDGSVVVGYLEGNRPVKWSAAGMEYLPNLPNGGIPGRAQAVSTDGTIMAGEGPNGGLVVWLPQVGAVDVVQALICRGNVSIVGFQNWQVSGMTSDGRHIVGGCSGGNWMIDIPRCPSDLNNDGIVDDADFSLFVVSYDIYLDTVGDLNYDCYTDDADFSFFVRAYDELLCP